MQKKSEYHPEKKHLSKQEIDMQLIENFIKMQKVMTDLTFKFENLSQKISNLLEVFEIAAKSFLDKQFSGKEDEKDLLIKLDTLLDQNKTIAKGLTLMEEKIRHKLEPNPNLPMSPHKHNEAELHGLYSNTQRPSPNLKRMF